MPQLSKSPQSEHDLLRENKFIESLKRLVVRVLRRGRGIGNRFNPERWLVVHVVAQMALPSIPKLPQNSCHLTHLQNRKVYLPLASRYIVVLCFHCPAPHWVDSVSALLLRAQNMECVGERRRINVVHKFIV